MEVLTTCVKEILAALKVEKKDECIREGLKRSSMQRRCHLKQARRIHTQQKRRERSDIKRSTYSRNEARLNNSRRQDALINFTAGIRPNIGQRPSKF